MIVTADSVREGLSDRARRLMRERSLLKPFPPIRGGAWGATDAPSRATQGMTKPPAPGAHARARTLRSNMTEAERRIWQILRSEQMQGHKFRRQVPIGRYIGEFVCHQDRLVH